MDALNLPPGVKVVVADHKALDIHTREATRTIMQEVVEEFKKFEPELFKQFRAFMLQNRRAGDNFSPGRTMRRSCEVPQWVYRALSIRLKDPDWFKKKQLIEMFKSEMPLAVYPKLTQDRSMLVTPEMKEAVDGDPQEAVESGDDHDGRGEADEGLGLSAPDRGRGSASLRPEPPEVDGEEGSGGQG